jgi:hypothetical protein
MSVASSSLKTAGPHVSCVVVAFLGIAIGLSACGSAASDPPAHIASLAPARPSQIARAGSHSAGAHSARGCPSPAAAARARAVLSGAMRRFQIESRGSTIRADLRYIAHDRVLLDALSSSNLAVARAEVGRLQHSQIVKHVTRIRVLRGSRVLVDGWPTSFDVAGSERELRDRRGRSLGRVQITIQDIIGFIKLEHRHEATEVVVRGAHGRVRTLLGAARKLSLPLSGCARVGARRYMVRSFKETGFAGEPLTIWLLTPA